MGSTLFAALFASAVAPAHGCSAPLPRGPMVPATVVVRTSCGVFDLKPDGRVARLPRGWLAQRTGGTGRRYGADVSIRRTHGGRFILARHGRAIWRSARVYYRTGGDIAFGPHLFAFDDYYTASSSPTCAARNGSSCPDAVSTRSASPAAADS